MAQETIVLTDTLGHKKRLLLPEELRFTGDEPRIMLTADRKKGLIITMRGKDEKSVQKAIKSVHSTMRIYGTILAMEGA